MGDHYLPSRHQAKKLPLFPLQLHQCRRCGHVQLNSRVDPAYLYTKYIYRTADSLGLVEHYRSYCLQVIRKISLCKGSHVVEIGSNDGSLLRQFKKKGMKVLGIDPARIISQEASLAGIPTWNRFFNQRTAREILRKQGPADLILANNVLANVPELTEIFKSVSILLKPSGHFVFETGYLKYLAEDHLFDNIYHEHIDYFSVSPLYQAVNHYGLQMVDSLENSSKGSSIRCFVKKTHEKVAPSRNLRKLLAREKRKKYSTPAPFLRLHKKILEIRKKIQKKVRIFRRRKKTIFGFGASVGVTTMLYFFGIGKNLNALLDDNPTRWNLWSPGFALPVLNPQIIHKKTIVIVLAWRYWKAIQRRHRKKQNLKLIKLS